MKPFILEILQNTKFMSFLFYFERPYIGSEFDEDMADYSHYQISDITCVSDSVFYKRNEFISKSTIWHYIDEECNLYGSLGNIIVVCDNEGQFAYFCHSFQNIPYIIFENMGARVQEKVKKYALSKGENYENLLQEYETWCRQNKLVIDKKIHPQEFNLLCLENHLKQIPEYLQYLFNSAVPFSSSDLAKEIPLIYEDIVSDFR